MQTNQYFWANGMVIQHLYIVLYSFLNFQSGQLLLYSCMTRNSLELKKQLLQREKHPIHPIYAFYIRQFEPDALLLLIANCSFLKFISQAQVRI